MSYDERGLAARRLTAFFRLASVGKFAPPQSVFGKNFGRFGKKI